MPKRTLFVFISVIYGASIAALFFFNAYFPGPLFSFSLLLWIVCLSVAFIYVLKSDFHFPEYIIFSVVPFLMSVAVIYLFFMADGDPFFMVVISLFATILLYITLLTINIINAATVRTVPLLKAARSSLVIVIGITSFLWSTFIIINPLSVEFAAWLWAFYTFLVSIVYFYLSKIEVVDEFVSRVAVPIHEAIVVSILMIVLVILTSSWNISTPVRVIYWTASLMVFLVTIQGKMTRSLTSKGLSELILLSWVLFVVALISGLG
ncbi:hypothetical protein KC571_02545 [candidate division WWE3 bacterium]|uniref:Uncharacterized protein n=1 Tax=candidate division WWE3 bacterium TaxID=2053526 RepID=A0A955LGP3_UNCKA|nr:hypothetical protein [candidate division WWE3 bacterium]